MFFKPKTPDQEAPISMAQQRRFGTFLRTSPDNTVLHFESKSNMSAIHMTYLFANFRLRTRPESIFSSRNALPKHQNSHHL